MIIRNILLNVGILYKLTYYTFDYAGRTVNGYSTDNQGKLLGASNAVYGGVGTTDRRNNRTLKKASSEGTLKRMALFSNSWIYYSYDALSRLSKREVEGILEEHYTYLSGSGAGTTTTLPETYYTTPKGSSTKLSGYRYAYDSRNNITRETNLLNNDYTTYEYDGLGQLTKAEVHETRGTLIYIYRYDGGGNLTSWEVQGEDGFVWECHQHSYGNSEWKDLLTALDGKSITYDANGNPTKYYNGATMTWRNGRQLASYSQGGKTYSYEYDVNGLRTKRSHADEGYTEYYIIDHPPQTSILINQYIISATTGLDIPLLICATVFPIITTQPAMVCIKVAIVSKNSPQSEMNTFDCII